MYGFLMLSPSLSALLYSRLQVHFWSHDGVGNKLVDDHPIVIGHEASGDQVAIEGSRPCRQCKRCKEGLYNLCPKMKFAACPPDMDGMLAKYFKIPADFCYKLPKGVGLEEGVLVEPLAVAVHAVRMANAQPGQSVAVFGSRTIGVLSAAVTKVYGAGKVVAVDLLDSKFDFAKRFNSSAIFKPNITVPAEVNEARLISENELGIGADAVIGASVAGSSVNTTIHETFMPSALDMTGKILDEFDARHVPSPYAGSENGKAQAFWRTMVCDLRPSGQRQDAGFEGLKRIMQSKDEPDDFQRGQDDYTRALSWQWVRNQEKYWWTNGRKFMTTEKGLRGHCTVGCGEGR